MQIQFLEMGGYRLSSEFRAVVTELLTDAHAEVAARMPSLADDYLVTVRFDKRVNETTGEMGRLVTPYWLDWAVDPDRDRMPAAIARARLRAIFAHETHHAVRAQAIQEAKPHPVRLPETPVDRSLLVPLRTTWLAQIAIEEGLANRFERDLIAEPSALDWDNYAGVPVAKWAEELVRAGNGSYLDWFFRLPDGREHVGYRVGAYLTDQAIEKSGLTAAELVATPVAEILQMAGY